MKTTSKFLNLCRIGTLPSDAVTMYESMIVACWVAPDKSEIFITFKDESIICIHLEKHIMAPLDTIEDLIDALVYSKEFETDFPVFVKNWNEVQEDKSILEKAEQIKLSQY